MPTVIATIGASNANSYIDVAGADAYHATRLHNAAWNDAATATKEAAVIWATRLLDDTFYWFGTKFTKEQALDWPRGGVFDENGYYIVETTLPAALQNATAELAFLLITEDRTITEEGGDSSGIESLTVASISLKFNVKDRKRKVNDYVGVMLKEFGIVDDGVQAGFVHLVRV